MANSGLWRFRKESTVAALLIVLLLSTAACGSPDVQAHPVYDEGSSQVETAMARATPEPTSVPTETIVPTPTASPVYEGREIADLALEFEGYSYVYGGRSPDEGFDCSGLVYYVYRQFGYKLFRVAADQATMGVHVEYEDLLPGDILCFKSPYQSTIGHVGIYVGDGLFIHAMDSLHGVVLWHLDDWIENRTLEARRLVGQLPKYSQEEILAIEIAEEEEIAAQLRAEEMRRILEEQKFNSNSLSTPSPETVNSQDQPDSQIPANESVTDKYRREAAEEAAARAAEEAARAVAGNEADFSSDSGQNGNDAAQEAASAPVSQVPADAAVTAPEIPAAPELPPVSDIPPVPEPPPIADIPVIIEQPPVMDVPVIIDQPPVIDVPVMIDQPPLTEIPIA